MLQTSSVSMKAVVLIIAVLPVL